MPDFLVSVKPERCTHATFAAGRVELVHNVEVDEM